MGIHLDPAIAWPGIALGLILLIFGRRLFWLFVGVLGFLLGAQLGATLLADQPLWVQLMLGLGAGVLGIVVSLIAQRVAFALVGFYAGAYLAINLSTLADVQAEPLWLVLAAGLVGAVVAALVTDWMLTVLASLVGAAAIVAGISVSPLVDLAVFVVLVAFGISVQSQAPKPR
jgi:hypothetical protein